jgi:hypothetical protein
VGLEWTKASLPAVAGSFPARTKQAVPAQARMIRALRLEKMAPPLLKLQRSSRDLDLVFICHSRLARHSTFGFRHSASALRFGAGVGRARGVGVALGVGVGLGVGVTLGVGVEVPLGVTVGLGVGVGDPHGTRV